MDDANGNAEGGPLKLRASPALAKLPSAPAPVAASASVPRPQPARTAPPGAPPDWADDLATTVNLGLVSLAVLTSFGWIYERRKRLAVTGAESILWAQDDAPHLSAKAELDRLLPDGPSAEDAARAIYSGSRPGGASRRRARLADLQGLARSLDRRWRRHDWDGAQTLLQRHLLDFPHTSPWVYLELLLVLRSVRRRADWDAAGASFQHRFGQKAPAWNADLRPEDSLADDKQLGPEVSRLWPTLDTRLWIERWMLGDPGVEIRVGPPLLSLGVYRDMLLLDTVLTHAAPREVPDDEAVPQS